MSPRNKEKFANIILACLTLGILILSLASCGGGGGGGGDFDEQTEPADVSLEAEPKSLDSGDRISVRVNLHNIHEDGVLVKIQYPIEMHYVTGSSFLKVDGDEFDVGPSAEIISGKENEEKSYLVYDFSDGTFDGERSATLFLKLEADSEVDRGGAIGVDVDFNDPSLNFDDKFDPLAPEFDATDTVKIEVNDSSGFITPTPSPTPTPKPTKKSS